MGKLVADQENLFPDIALADDDDDPNDRFIDSSRLGRYAEFMVCAELTRLGYHVLHVDAPGFDLILSVEDRSLRVQVKSTATIKYPPPPQPGRGRPPRREPYAAWNCYKHQGSSNGGKYQRPLQPITRADADMIALFHHKFGTVIFLPIETTKRRRVELPLSQVKRDNANATLQATLSKVLSKQS